MTSTRTDLPTLGRVDAGEVSTVPQGPENFFERRRVRRIALSAVVGIYLLVTVTFSLLIPAGESNDELSHVQYIEYVLHSHHIPRISLANGHESHQPPLFYFAGAAFQFVLGIEPFSLQLPPGPHAGDFGQLQLSHRYTVAEHRDAIRVHELRMLSVLFGLCTVLLTYAAARLSMRRSSVALAAALFVALLPKEVLVSASVTNDSLVITLSSLALVLGLLWWRSVTHTDRSHSGHFWLAVTFGSVLGLAALTKFNALPLAAMLVALAAVLVFVYRQTVSNRAWLDILLMILGFFAASGWWFLRNEHLYGQFLAQHSSDAYLQNWLPGLIKHRSLFSSFGFALPYLYRTVWYDGDFNQFVLANWVYFALAILTLLSFVAFVSLVLPRSKGRHSVAARQDLRVPWPRAAFLLVAVAAGLLAVLIIATDTNQAEGRVAYVGLSAFAVIMVGGLRTIGTLTPRTTRVRALPDGLLLVWPVVFLVVDAYVLAHFVIPFRGL